MTPRIGVISKNEGSAQQLSELDGESIAKMVQNLIGSPCNRSRQGGAGFILPAS